MSANSRWLIILVIFSIFSIFVFPSTSYAGTSWLKYFRKDTLLNTNLRSYIGHGDRLFVGTNGDGIVVYTGTETKNYTSKNTNSCPEKHDGLICDAITVLAIDEKNGRIWVGTGEGLCSCDLEMTDWQRFTSKDGLPNDVIRDIAVDEKGVIWVGTPSGIARFDGETWTSFTSQNGLFEDSVHGIRIQGDEVWVATVGGSVSRFKDGAWKTFVHN